MPCLRQNVARDAARTAQPRRGHRGKRWCSMWLFRPPKTKSCEARVPRLRVTAISCMKQRDRLVRLDHARADVVHEEDRAGVRADQQRHQRVVQQAHPPMPSAAPAAQPQARSAAPAQPGRRGSFADCAAAYASCRASASSPATTTRIQMRSAWCRLISLPRPVLSRADCGIHAEKLGLHVGVARPVVASADGAGVDVRKYEDAQPLARC